MMNWDEANWINPPKKFSIADGQVNINTESNTDLWQKTHYGFCHDNAHMLLLPLKQESFTFWLRTDFESKVRYDQCGLCVYQDSENWLKASIEYEDGHVQRLGSVVTNGGWSDWATVDIPAEVRYMYYRLSRRGNDFLIENSLDGMQYNQMRIAHLAAATGTVNVGIYACSPGESSFYSVFSALNLTECKWAKEG